MPESVLVFSFIVSVSIVAISIFAFIVRVYRVIHMGYRGGQTSKLGSLFDPASVLVYVLAVTLVVTSSPAVFQVDRPMAAVVALVLRGAGLALACIILLNEISGARRTIRRDG